MNRLVYLVTFLITTVAPAFASLRATARRQNEVVAMDDENLKLTHEEREFWDRFLHGGSMQSMDTTFSGAEISSPTSEELSLSPSSAPIAVSSDAPSSVPSMVFSDEPSLIPSDQPSSVPTATLSDEPSRIPSTPPSPAPSAALSDQPSSVPTATLSDQPSAIPTLTQSDQPSAVPSIPPSPAPTVPLEPSSSPSFQAKVLAASGGYPTTAPSSTPTYHPLIFSAAAISPTVVPSTAPTEPLVCSLELSLTCWILDGPTELMGLPCGTVVGDSEPTNVMGKYRIDLVNNGVHPIELISISTYYSGGSVNLSGLVDGEVLAPGSTTAVSFLDSEPLRVHSVVHAITSVRYQVDSSLPCRDTHSESVATLPKY